MRINELKSFIASRVDYVWFPNKFPPTGPDRCGYVRLTGGFPTNDLGKKQPSWQVMLRAEGSGAGAAEVEAKANEIYAALTNLRDVTIGEDSIVIIRCMNSEPLYLGDDENGRPLYSINFNAVVRP